MYKFLVYISRIFCNFLFTMQENVTCIQRSSPYILKGIFYIHFCVKICPLSNRYINLDHYYFLSFLSVTFKVFSRRFFFYCIFCVFTEPSPNCKFYLDPREYKLTQGEIYDIFDITSHHIIQSHISFTKNYI